MAGTTDERESALSNSLLYRHIQETFDYLTDRGMVGGVPQEVLRKLQGAWLEGLTEHQPGSQAPSDQAGPGRNPGLHDAFDDILTRLPDMRRTIKESEFKLPSAVIGDIGAHLGEFLDEFQHQQPRIARRGTEAYATYLPIHYFAERSDFGTYWGIYISVEGVLQLAASLRDIAVGCLGEPKLQQRSDPGGEEGEDSSRLSEEARIAGVFCEIAYQVLLRHELQHFKIEAFTLHAELLTGRSLYVPYIRNIYAETWPAIECVEEGLANQTVLDSRVIDKLFRELYDMDDDSSSFFWNQVIETAFFDGQPDAYRPARYQQYWEQSRSAWSRRSRSGVLALEARREAMNHLCNLILALQTADDSRPVPFYAFPPDNHFLRATELVPIHLVHAIGDDELFIRVAPPKMRELKAYLRKVGYRCVDGRGKGDHEWWECEGRPRITLNRRHDHVDGNSLDTVGRALGLTRAELNRSMNEFKRTKGISLASRDTARVADVRR